MEFGSNCACDGALDNGCPLCNQERLDEWFSDRVRTDAPVYLLVSNAVSKSEFVCIPRSLYLQAMDTIDEFGCGVRLITINEVASKAGLRTLLRGMNP